MPSIEQTPEGELVNNSSTYGKAAIDGFDLGSNWFAPFTCLSAVNTALTAFCTFGTFGLPGIISRSLATLSLPLVLTAVAPAQMEK